jgi:hypothetical protein
VDRLLLDGDNAPAAPLRHEDRSAHGRPEGQRRGAAERAHPINLAAVGQRAGNPPARVVARSTTTAPSTATSSDDVARTSSAPIDSGFPPPSPPRAKGYRRSC